MGQVGRLNGKVAIVTGAAGGIGEAICQRFLAEGSIVMMVDFNQENLEAVYEKFSATYKDKVAMIQGDVAKENSATEAFASTHSQFGQTCNVLVNCAGIGIPSSIVNETTCDFNRTIDVNLVGVFNFTREFLRRLELNEMKDATGASIVNIASLAAKTGLVEGSAYAASKAGVVALTKTTCIEVGRFGVRCNALTPGFVNTPMLNHAVQEMLEAVKPTIPMKRFGNRSKLLMLVCSWQAMKALTSMGPYFKFLVV